MIVKYHITANDLGTAAALAAQRAFADRFTRTDIVGITQTGRTEFEITLNTDCDNCNSDSAGYHHLLPVWAHGGALIA